MLVQEEVVRFHFRVQVPIQWPKRDGALSPSDEQAVRTTGADEVVPR